MNYFSEELIIDTVEELDLDDDLFIETCESFNDNELEQLQKQLDTPKYKETIQIFTQRVKEVANNRLAEITNAATAEIQRLEQVILDSRNAIYSLRAEIENANVKYAL